MTNITINLSETSNITTVFQIDVLVQSGQSVEIGNISTELLEALQANRPQYKIVFKI